MLTELDLMKTLRPHPHPQDTACLGHLISHKNCEWFKSSFITSFKISILTNVTHNNYIFHCSPLNHNEKDKP